jgi:hypothetical protein
VLLANAKISNNYQEISMPEMFQNCTKVNVISGSNGGSVYEIISNLTVFVTAKELEVVFNTIQILLDKQ